jgi:hypothetical protein
VTARTRDGLIVAAAVIIVMAIHAGIALRHSQPPTRYYQMLADAFADRQLNLTQGPAKELLELSDPYDARANQDHRLHDAILFQGKYYLYWGPVPALLLLPARLIGLGLASDRLLCALFTEATIVLIAVALWLIRKQWFPQSGVWPVIAGIFAAGLCSAIPFLFSRPSVYEAAIMAGQCFLIGAVVCVLLALQRDSEIERKWLLFAGICAALAAGSRLNLGPLVAVLILIILWELHRRGEALRQLLSDAARLILPLALVVGALGIYNLARFGSSRESGIRYMLASRSARIALGTGKAFQFDYLGQNLKLYLFAPVDWMTNAALVAPRRDFQPKGAPRAFRSDIVAGLIVASPVFLLALLPMAKRPLWSIAAIIAAMGPALLFFYCSMRYLADITPGLAILSAVAMMHFRGNAKFVVAAALLLVYSCAVGISLAVVGYS